MKTITRDRKIRRELRVSANILGSEKRPRIKVFRSNKYIYAQAIDDVKRTTVASFSSLKIAKEKNYTRKKKINEATEVGVRLAKLLQDKKITTVVFDRGVYAYNGRVKALAEGLRSGGIKV